MSENEKLRALLAEARLCVAYAHREPKLNVDPALLARIDAALAEPPPSLDLVARLQRERDEARAEVERLKQDREAVFFRGEDDGYKRGRRNGFRYGAEAMREAAASVLGVDDVYEMRIAIRALPIPEDKP